ncbi:uncharacterized protein PITG_05453 [Phytophthora infestans T30-4]|uniref:Transmembrane protein n=1 Tax=Phytophthora infestans (strain T30-4) TaxID=403677 RepID=D0N2V0_PHYIT|nr:uncharacterized protein PITG_05453 [Phytophthora infestans T30-4]EEY69242.1 conserved hypothetical protein [Phytophthora infestans T30-4]|eukprot:XP_002999096.1 conserved hypothetical protein [Phytophthora infestans T30-4]
MSESSPRSLQPMPVNSTRSVEMLMVAPIKSTAGHNKEFDFVSPRTNAKTGPRFDAIAVLVVMSFKVLVAPIILVAICVNSPYLQSPYVFRAASESFLGYEKLNPDVTYDCPDCGVTCKQSVLQLAQFKQDPMMGKPAYGSLRTNTFEDYNETLSAAALALIDELESANAVRGRSQTSGFQ